MNRLLYSRSASCTRRVSLQPREAEALHFLLPLSDDYPGIDHWYLTKVVPGLRDGSRYMLPVERDGHLVGLGIAKRDAVEHKICTVRVAPQFANRGIGVRIFDSLLTWLQVDKPHLTVSDGKLAQFERIFDYYGFRLSSRRLGQYVPSACELGYNEEVREPSMCPSAFQTDIISSAAGSSPIDRVRDAARPRPIRRSADRA